MEQTNKIIPQMLDETEVARALAVSVAALRRWRREGRGPQFKRLERCVRYDLRAIERFLAENRSAFRTLEPRDPSQSACELIDKDERALANEVQP